MSGPLALSLDLYCLTCGYNLRGLSGDPIRCPECGNLNPIGDVEIPAEIITRTLRQLETAPALCVAATGAPLTLLLLVGIMRWAWRVPLGDIGACLGAPALVCALVWFFGCIRFRSLCLAKAGWFTALAMYHAWGLLLMLVTVFGTCGIVYGMSLLLPRWDGVVILLSLPPAAALLFWFVPLAYRRAVARIVPLQREIAITLARDQVRRRLATQRRGLLG